MLSRPGYVFFMQVRGALQPVTGSMGESGPQVNSSALQEGAQLPAEFFFKAEGTITAISCFFSLKAKIKH